MPSLPESSTEQPPTFRVPPFGANACVELLSTAPHSAVQSSLRAHITAALSCFVRGHSRAPPTVDW